VLACRSGSDKKCHPPPTFQQPMAIFHMSSFQINASSYSFYSFNCLCSEISSTAFDCVSPHTYTINVITMNVPAENNLRRESLINSNISKCYKNVLQWLKDNTVGVKVIIGSCARNVLRSECPVKFLLSLDNTHHAEVWEA